MVQGLLTGLLCAGHVLLEGLPGLAKTLAVQSLARAIDTGFTRIQFTPDMLPADVIGTEIFNPREASYSVKKGPIFSNLILADEINRAPAKVQAALLEAMQERQGTIGSMTAAQLGVRTVDVGNPQYAMHSVREMAGTWDHWYMAEAMRAYYTGE